MLLHHDNSPTIVGGLNEQRAFNVEMNSMLFHTVIAGIYADRIRAPFREIATNARDAHAAANKLHIPFDVELPSLLSPSFKIRDYGTGMSHDEMMGLYSTMFASSKRASNDSVGMIGLGSKSPFAYTSTFSISAWQNGRRRLYTCFLNDEGVPQIALLADMESKEPDGVEVSFAIQPVDVTRFRDAASEVLFGFDPKPRILNEQFEWKVPVSLFQGDGWTIYDPATVPFKTPMARQGCVLYPIDAAAIDMRGHPLFGWACVIDFPIGELSVSTSREQLGYDQRTKANVVARIDETLAKMTTLVQDEVDAKATYLDACEMLEEQLTNGAKKPIYLLLKDKIQWQGKTLTTRFTFPRMGAGYRIAVFDSDTVQMGVVKASVAHRTAPGTAAFAAGRFNKRTKVYLETPGLKQAASRVRRIVSEAQATDDIVWIRAQADAELPDLGGKQIIDLSTIQPLSFAQAKSANNRRMLCYIDPSVRYERFNGNNKPARGSIELVPDILYVKRHKYRYTLNGRLTYLSDVWGTLGTALRAGVLPSDAKVLILTEEQITKISRTVSLMPVDTFIRDKLKEMLTVDQLAALHSNSYNTAQNQWASLANRFAKNPMPADLKEWVDAVIAGSTQITVVSHELANLARNFLSEAIKTAGANDTTLGGKREALAKKYPLLFTLISSYQNDHLKHYMELISR